MKRTYSNNPYRPGRFHAGVALGLTLILALALWVLLGRRETWPWLFGVWLAGINLTALGYYGYDKNQAVRGGRRVPERVLHGLALLGGSFGAWLGMRLFRHKTLKGPFRLVFWLIVLFQALLVGWIGWELWRNA